MLSKILGFFALLEKRQIVIYSVVLVITVVVLTLSICSVQKNEPTIQVNEVHKQIKKDKKAVQKESEIYIERTRERKKKNEEILSDEDLEEKIIKRIDEEIERKKKEYLKEVKGLND